MCGCETCFSFDEYGCDQLAMEEFDICSSCDDGEHI